MPARLALPLFAITLTLCAAPAYAEPSREELLKIIQRLQERIERLEEGSAKVARGLASETISENEAELTSRLKAVENQSLGMMKAARTIQALDGITAGASLTTVAQHASARPPGSPAGASQLNYRGDVYVGLPLANIGATENRIFAHFRLGQGNGLNSMASFAKPNASAFRVQSAQPDDSVAVLGQAWYEASIPLPAGGFKPHARERLEINFGKMDPFIFFDQNAAANDETRQFLNTVFVHNALLDAGGDIGADANGFSPGFRVSYLNEKRKPEGWRLSLGVFGAGEGANYSRFFGSPLVIAQAESQVRTFDGLTGNFRAYYWRNGRASSFAGGTGRHSGLGLSVDQRWDDAVTLFGRFGKQLSGRTRFDLALSLGAEIGGSYWARGGDAVGAALSVQRTSREFRRDSLDVDADADGVPDFGYAARGAERVLEAYYRYRISQQFELSPDFQWIGAPGGNSAARPVRILGLRAQITY